MCWYITNFTTWPALSWLERSVVGRAEVMGSIPVKAWNFFQALISRNLKLCITAISNHAFISFSAVQSYSRIYIYFIIFGYITNSQRDQLSVGLIAHDQLMKKTAPVSCHGFESRSGLNFRLKFHNSLSCVQLRWSISFSALQFKYKDFQGNRNCARRLGSTKVLYVTNMSQMRTNVSRIAT